MGTSASCQSNNINVSSETLREDDHPYSARKESHPMESLSEHLCSEVSEEQNKVHLLEEEIHRLKIKLHEYEEEIKLVHDLRTREELPTVDESLKVKELQLKKANEDIEKLNNDMMKLKIRCKRKLKQTTSQMTEAKQTSTIRIMELRAEIQQLNLENLQLKEKIGLSNASITTPRSTNSSQMTDETNKKLVVELSSQLQEQIDEKVKFQKLLNDRNEYIAQLEEKCGVKEKITRKKRPIKQQECKRLLSGQSRDSGLESDYHPDSASGVRQTLTTVNENGPPLENSFVSELSEDLNADTESMDSYDTTLSDHFLRGGGGPYSKRMQSIIFDPDTQKTIENLIKE